MSDKGFTRRSFLAATTLSAAAAATFTGKTRVNAARVVPRRVSPNEKLNIAAIGSGGMGAGDIMSCHREGENIVALCDVDWERAAGTFENIPNARRFKDYREMLEEMPEIDAVTVSTPDHAHAHAAYTAMKLGKHVYVQKPMTYTVAEARLLLETARETGVATQMGNQGHCQDGVRELCEMLWSGAIGQVREAHVWTNRPVWPQGHEYIEMMPEEDIPETLDWDLWLNSAPERPFNAIYVPFGWRGWWDFGTGALGDMACHIMDPAFWSLRLMDVEEYTVELVEENGNNSQTFPDSSIVKYSFPARGGMDPVDVYWYDGGLMPPHPEGVPEDQRIGQGNNGSYFVGEDGHLTAGEYGGQARLLPDERMEDYERPPQIIPRIPDESPYRNWIQACKGGVPAASNFEYSCPFTEMVVFGNLALRAPGKLEYNAKDMHIKNMPEANQYLTKEYRSGWELPVPTPGAGA